MSLQRVALAVSAAVCFTGEASAELAGVHVELSPEQHPNREVVTYRVYLDFTDPMDTLLAIEGNSDVAPLVFESDSVLRQHCLLPGSVLCDVSGVFALAGDSWVNIGDEEGDTELSPGFLGGDGVYSVIRGCSFEQPDNGGYFDSNPSTPVRPDERGRIVIAQFSLHEADPCFVYSGTAVYAPDGVGKERVGFFMHCGPPPQCVPCPGDADDDGSVGFGDVLEVLANWGACGLCPPDIDQDGDVDFDDLLIVLSTWGPC